MQLSYKHTVPCCFRSNFSSRYAVIHDFILLSIASPECNSSAVQQLYTTTDCTVPGFRYAQNLNTKRSGQCSRYLSEGFVECCACGHFSQFPDEHGCIAGWWQLEGELQSKQIAAFAFCSQSKQGNKWIPALNLVHDRLTTLPTAGSNNVKTKNILTDMQCFNQTVWTGIQCCNQTGDLMLSTKQVSLAVNALRKHRPNTCHGSS